MANEEKTGQEVEAEAALRRVAVLCYEFLLKQTEPVRMGEIVTSVVKQIPTTAKVVRYALMDHTRFLLVDRQWDLVARDLDTRRARERLIADLIQPMATRWTWRSSAVSCPTPWPGDLRPWRRWWTGW
jgi:hypothetical protein